MDAMVVTDDKRIVDECLSHDIPVDIVTYHVSLVQTEFRFELKR